jgi:hypothetical protein
MFVGNPERKSPMRRFRCKWKHNFKIGLEEVAW